MKPNITHPFLAAALLIGIGTLDARTITSLDQGWAIFAGEISGADKADIDTTSWRKLDVPHDWSIEGDFKKEAATTGSGGWLPSGVTWYRRAFTLPEDAKGQRVWLEFDGVMARSEVWLNGKLLGKRPNGYVSFRYDITDQLKADGPNLLAVKADTSAQPASRWYTGNGIYRHVRLVTVAPVHVRPWGVYVTTPEVDTDSATVKIQTSVGNSSAKAGKFSLRTAVMGPDGNPLSTVSSEVPLDAGKSAALDQQIKIPHPALWNLESPNLHTLVTRIYDRETLLDEVCTPFGIRKAEFRTDTGFWLNGKNFKLKGVCLHHDGGAVGAAVPLDVWERRLNQLRELGVNAIRTAHNPPAPEFLDLCDRMGFLVMDEFFDCWLKAKNPHDYHRDFKEWSLTDLREGILRDRNHPSVILYSVGNEIHDTTKPESAKEILRGLVDLCHEVDPSRPVTQALFRPNVSGDYTNGLADMLDVIGTNYRDKELLDAWKAKPGRLIVGTEQGHERSTWLNCRDNPQHSGQFLWVGIDYLGESRSWPLTVFNAGLLDRAGFVQPRGYERQSWWSEKPMVQAFRRIGITAATPADPGYEALEWNRRKVLFSDWNPADTAAHDENVEIYSNAEEVELFLNDRSLGKKAVRKDAASLNWQVPYQPGVLKAVASTQGKEVASDVLRTAGRPSKIVLLPDKRSLTRTFDSCANIEIQLVDENGTLVPNSDAKITFTLSGPGKIIAVDSGNVVSTERFQASERMTDQGRALALVRATDKGNITFTANAEGLPPASLELAVP